MGLEQGQELLRASEGPKRVRYAEGSSYDRMQEIIHVHPLSFRLPCKTNEKCCHIFKHGRFVSASPNELTVVWERRTKKMVPNVVISTHQETHVLNKYCFLIMEHGWSPEVYLVFCTAVGRMVWIFGWSSGWPKVWRSA